MLDIIVSINAEFEDLQTEKRILTKIENCKNAKMKMKNGSSDCADGRQPQRNKETMNKRRMIVTAKCGSITSKTIELYPSEIWRENHLAPFVPCLSLSSTVSETKK